MDTDDLLSMSLDQMIASKPKKKFDGGKARGGGKMQARSGRAGRQQQSQPYNRPAAKLSVGGGPGGNRVYVGNLAWTVTWKELKDLMATCGPCKADVPAGPDGRSKV